MTGYEATAAIRALDGPAAHTPIVAMTAHALSDARATSLAAGMDDHLAKPFKLADLSRILEQWGDPGSLSRVKVLRSAYDVAPSPSFDMAMDMAMRTRAREAHFLGRVPAHVRFDVQEVLPDGSALAWTPAAASAVGRGSACSCA